MNSLTPQKICGTLQSGLSWKTTEKDLAVTVDGVSFNVFWFIPLLLPHACSIIGLPIENHPKHQWGQKREGAGNNYICAIQYNTINAFLFLFLGIWTNFLFCFFVFFFQCMFKYFSTEYIHVQIHFHQIDFNNKNTFLWVSNCFFCIQSWPNSHFVCYFVLWLAVALGWVSS